jgi:hypothetical protein
LSVVTYSSTKRQQQFLPTATPVISPNGGTFTSAQTVSMSCSTPGAVIYYTTDGTTPDPTDPVYSGPFTVGVSETVNAVAQGAGYYLLSGVASAQFTISIPPPPPPPSSSTVARKWNPGHYIMTTTPGNVVASEVGYIVNAFGSHLSKLQGYSCWLPWVELETAEGVYNFALIVSMYNTLQSLWPNAHFKIMLGGYSNWTATVPRNPGSPIGSVSGAIVPDYILNDPGTYGAGPTGSSQGGFAFSTINNPGAWSAGTSYAKGALVGNGNYVYEATAANTGSTPGSSGNWTQVVGNCQYINAALWNANVNARFMALAAALLAYSFTDTSASEYNGQTFTIDEHPLFEQINFYGPNDLNMQRWSGGGLYPQCPSDYSGDAWQAGFEQQCVDLQNAATYTNVALQVGYGGTPEPVPDQLALLQVMQENVIAVSCTDVYPSGDLTYAQHYDVGHTLTGYDSNENPTWSSGGGAGYGFTYSLPQQPTVQGPDYGGKHGGGLPSGVPANSNAVVLAIFNQCVSVLCASHIDWCIASELDFALPGNLDSFIAPGIIALPAFPPVCLQIPTSYMTAPTALVWNNIVAGVPTISWTAAPYAVGYQIYRNGSPVGTTTGATSWSEGAPLSAGTYEYTVAMTNLKGTGPVSAPLAVVVGSPIVLYSNGSYPLWPHDYSYGLTVNNPAYTTNPEPGHTQSYAIESNQGPNNYGAGLQRTSHWETPPTGTDGTDISSCTRLQFDIYPVVNPPIIDWYGDTSNLLQNDATLGPQLHTTGMSAIFAGLKLNQWNYGVQMPLCYCGHLSNYNLYKFNWCPNSGSLLQFDNCEYIPGNTAWIYRGNPALEAGWTDASANCSVNYAVQPGSIVSGMQAGNTSPAPDCQCTAAVSGGILTVSSVSVGAVKVGMSIRTDSGGALLGTVTGTSGPNWTTTAANFSSQTCIIGFPQSYVSMAEVTVAAAGGTWRANYAAGYSLSGFNNFSFSAVPTQSGYGYQVQFYNASGALGSPVTAATINDAGVNGMSTYVVPLPDAVRGQTITGVSIEDTSGRSANVFGLSQVGLWT